MSPFAQRVYSAVRVAFRNVPDARIRTVDGASGVTVTVSEVHGGRAYRVTGVLARDVGDANVVRFAGRIRGRRNAELGMIGVGRQLRALGESAARALKPLGQISSTLERARSAER